MNPVIIKKIERIYNYYLFKYNAFIDIVLNNENIAEKRNIFEKIKVHGDICFSIIDFIFNDKINDSNSKVNLKVFLKTIINKLNKAASENKINLTYEDNAYFSIPEIFYEKFLIYVLSVYCMKFIDKKITIDINIKSDSEKHSTLKADIIIENNAVAQTLYSLWQESGCEEIAELNNIKATFFHANNKFTIFLPLINIIKDELQSNNFSAISKPGPESEPDLKPVSKNLNLEKNTMTNSPLNPETFFEVISPDLAMKQVKKNHAEAVTASPEKTITVKAFNYEKLFLQCKENKNNVAKLVNNFTRSFFNYFYKLNTLLYENNIKNFLIIINDLKKLAESCCAETIVLSLEEIEKNTQTKKNLNMLSKSLENLNIEFEIFNKELSKYELEI